MLRLSLAVGCGTAAGALLRFLAGLMLPPLLATGFVNVAGSLFIGLVATMSAPGGRLPLGPIGRHVLMTGVAGGFTTFSAMSLDTFLLLSGRRVGLALIYLAASVLLSVAAVWLGHMLAERLNRRA